MKNALRGTGVALVTPFDSNGNIDYKSLERLVNQTIKGGVDFLVVLGTTGEAPVLTDRERQAVMDAVVKCCDRRVPVVCGIGGNVTSHVIKALHEYNLHDIDAVLSVVPYYNKPAQEGLYQHFKAVAASTKKEILLYNVPGRTGSNLLPQTVARLAKDCRNIIGIKEASGNLAQCMELIATVPPGFLVLSGDDDLALAHMAIGMNGIISVAANCFTMDFTEMINLALINKFDKARKIHYRLLQGINLLFAEGNPAGVKAVLSETGICENYLRLPLVPVSSHTQQQIRTFLDGLKD